MSFFEPQQIGDKLVSPFTIPSGIITTNPRTLEWVMNNIPEIGILTTKSIGPRPRLVKDVYNEDMKGVDFANREPIIYHLGSSTFVNAVGLSNPGAEQFVKEYSGIKVPDNKFLLASIFGGSIDEFVFVANTIESTVDGFELNLSCPHAKGQGMALGQDPKIVGEIVSAVRNVTSKPIFAKLTPNTEIIGEIAKAAMDSGAYGLVLINTVGPERVEYDGYPVLTNKVGGKSGWNTLELGIRRTKEVVAAVGNVPIICMGGISTAADIVRYHDAGGTYFGVGSALAGMTNSDKINYFRKLPYDIDKGTNSAAEFLREVDTRYRKVTITESTSPGCLEFKIIKTDSSIDAKAGQYIFAWIPDIGEKPFSVMDDDPLTLGILEREHEGRKGKFTSAINAMKEGDSFYVRGPYGSGVEVIPGSNVVLVGGGSGIAGIYLLAKQLSEENHIITMLAGREKGRIPYIEEFRKFGEVFIATNDGSIGLNGLATDLFRKNSDRIPKYSFFFNCGPREMVEKLAVMQESYTSHERIFTSEDYKTSCGIAICGRCYEPEKGRLTCVDGPFMNR